MYRPKYTLLSNRIDLYLESLRKGNVSTSVIEDHKRKIRESWSQLTDEEKTDFVYDEATGNSLWNELVIAQGN